MLNNKVYSLLRTCSKSELVEFRRFILSPYFNQSRKVLKLFDFIRRFHPDFNSRSLNNKTLYEVIFQSRKKNDRVIQNLFTRLIRLYNLFLCSNHFLSNTMMLDYCMLEQYKIRGLDKLLASKSGHLVSMVDAGFRHDSSYYYYNYSYYFQYVEHIYRSMLSGKVTNMNLHLSEMYTLLQNFRYQNMVKILARFAINRTLQKSDGKPDTNISSLLKELYKVPLTNKHPAKQIFSSFAFSFLKNKPVNYEEIKIELNKIRKYITDEDFDLILILMLTCFLPYIDENNRMLVKERFNHIKLMVERRVWNAVGGQFIEHNFSYSVSSALKAGEHEWAELFIKNYSGFVNKEQRQDSVNYNLAHLNYIKAQYQKHDNTKFYELAREYLSLFRTKDYYRKINAFELGIKILYETREFDLLLYETESYIHYLKKHSVDIIEQIFKSHLNFANFSLRLVKITIDKNTERAFNLSKHIETADFCLNKSWLLANLRPVLEPS